jgi:hypothetical protein
MTSEETFGISAGLHTNMSLLWRRKSTSSLSYLGSRVVLICTVLVGSLASIHMALASLVTLKAPTVGGMARPSGTEGTQRLSSHNSAATIATTASSMLPPR